MHEGYQALIGELLILTYLDVKPRAKKGGRYFQIRQEALSFLDTPWFETLCAAIELDSRSGKAEDASGVRLGSGQRIREGPIAPLPLFLL